MIDYATFALTMQLKNEAHFVLESHLYNPFRNNFLALFENVVLGGLKLLFQLNHQVDISLYLTEATSLGN